MNLTPNVREISNIWGALYKYVELNRNYVSPKIISLLELHQVLTYN